MQFNYDPNNPGGFGGFGNVGAGMDGVNVNIPYTPPQVTAPPGSSFWGKAKDYGSQAWDGAKDYGGRAGAATVGAINATPGVIGSGIGKVWKSGTPGKVGLIGLGALGATRVAYPLLSGANVIDDQTQEYIGGNAVGRFVTGEPEYDAARTNAILKNEIANYEDKQLQRSLEDQARLEQQYRDRTDYNSQVAYEQAQRSGRLGLALGTAAKFRDVYAGQLADSTRNYIATMNSANDAIGRILNPNLTVI